MPRPASARIPSPRLAWWFAGLSVVAGLVYLMATASTGPIDPTEAKGAESHGTVVFNSAIIVFREGLEAVLIAASSLGPKLEAITGFLAIVVLNGFVHKVYWSEWIGRHHRQRRRMLARTGTAATFGLVALGFTSVFARGSRSCSSYRPCSCRPGRPPCSKGWPSAWRAQRSWA